MSRKWTVYLMTKSSTKRFELSGITTVGGINSEGHQVEGLKYKDEYIILSPTEKGVIAHCLKGKAKKTEEICSEKHLVVHDLTLLVTPITSAGDSNNREVSHQRFLDDTKHLLESFSSTKNFDSSLQLLFDSVLCQINMEKGLMITKDHQGQFTTVIEKNIGENDSWMSETLVQKTLDAKEPIVISNIIGSDFESSQSLMATGFLSIISWPLAVRGENLGVLLVGSDKPHSGLSLEQKNHMQAYIRMAALMLQFHLRDLQMQEQIKSLKNRYRNNDCPINTSYKPLEETIGLAHQISQTNLSALIQGETGTGKEVLAQWIHKQSGRRGPFVALNCSSIPENLLESILFGHRKGAFTGAIKDQKGKFELANFGTLFLDEVGDLPEELQAKLLRAIQEKKIEPVGAQREISVDVRILSATHKELPNLIAQGKFREDLYYRLAEVTLELPPLRERIGDIELIVNEVMQEFDGTKFLATAAWQWLKQQDWKGNIRELLSAVRRAAALSSTNEIQKEHFLLGAPKSPKAQGWLGAETLELAKQGFIHEKVRKALAVTDNNRTHASKLLGVTPRTLFRYLEDMEEL